MCEEQEQHDGERGRERQADADHLRIRSPAGDCIDDEVSHREEARSNREPREPGHLW
jgi:hypothetical protein